MVAPTLWLAPAAPCMTGKTMKKGHADWRALGGCCVYDGRGWRPRQPAYAANFRVVEAPTPTAMMGVALDRYPPERNAMLATKPM